MSIHASSLEEMLGNPKNEKVRWIRLLPNVPPEIDKMIYHIRAANLLSRWSLFGESASVQVVVRNLILRVAPSKFKE